MRHRRKKRRKDFSKSRFDLIGLTTLGVTIFVCVMVWRTGDLSPLAYLIPSVFGVCTTATAFYYNKAKRENEIKLRKLHGSEIYNDTKEGYSNESSYV